MSCSHNCICSHRRRHLIIFLLFLLVSSLTQVKLMTEGRANFKPVDVAKMRSEEKAMVRTQIGSRPPRCERRCTSCGHCEAVQVPVVPQDRRGSKHSIKTSTIASSRGEDISNYKPMSWKCKCGDMIFNP